MYFYCVLLWILVAKKVFDGKVRMWQGSEIFPIFAAPNISEKIILGRDEQDKKYFSRPSIPPTAGLRTRQSRPSVGLITRQKGRDISHAEPQRSQRFNVLEQPITHTFRIQHSAFRIFIQESP